jgi:uncharacterized protein
MKILPTQARERIAALDALRGFAILGILLMNIQSFSMIGAAYFLPNTYGDFAGINKWVWQFTHLFADLKFISLFSVLFGAGMVLFTERLVAKGIKGLRLHYRRTFWLLLLGLIHAYAIWHGDILVTYAFCALFVVLFRKKKPVTLFVLGAVFLLIGSGLYVMSGLSLPHWPPEALEGFKANWNPGSEAVAKEVAIFRGSWLEQMDKRVEESIIMQTMVFFYFMVWRCTGMMLLGMALYKSRIITGERSSGFYKRLLAIGLIVGLSIILFGIHQNQKASFAVEYSFFIGSQFNYWGSIGMVLAYLALIMLLVKNVEKNWLVKSLSAVGQMALSNYLIQSLICSFIFYGHGLGLFGSLERWQQLLIVIGIWVLQMIYSPIWLKYFKYGPFEWLWRSLTYWKVQSIKK